MNLTEAIIYTRRAIPFLIVSFFLFIVFYLLLQFAFKNIGPTQQAPQAPSYNILFGKIPQLQFSSRIDYPPKATFSLDTLSGKPTEASSSANVYFLPVRPVRFGYLQKAYFMAKTLGFDTTFTKHTTKDTTLTIEDEEKKVNIDITNFNYDFKLNYETRPELFSDSIVPTKQVAAEFAKQFLRALGKYHDEFVRSQPEVIYMRFEHDTGEFSVVENAEEANVVEVDFFRPDMPGGFSLRPPRYFNSQNYVVMTFTPTGYKVIKSQIKYFPYDAQNIGIYPIKTASQAYEELQKGNGTIVSAGKNGSAISIEKMFLGYYDPEIYQTYLQPIFVFLGKNGFVAYVPALHDDYVEK